MERDAQDVRRAVAARDAASLRVRNATRISVAVGIALTGIFAAVAAGSTHTKKIVVQRVRARRTKTAATSSAPVTAPAPPIVGAGQSPSSSSGQAAPSQTPAASAPSPAPASVPPTVVSGGS